MGGMILMAVSPRYTMPFGNTYELCMSLVRAQSSAQREKCNICVKNHEEYEEEIGE